MSDINCDCGYNYTQTGCPNCKHIPIDYTQEYEQALANMQREYDKRRKRIEELEAVNKLLNEQLDSIEEMGTESLNALPDCLMQLAPALVENDELKAKLKMAVEALGIAAEWLDDYSAFTGNTYETTKSKTVRVAIAKIKGDKP